MPRLLGSLLVLGLSLGAFATAAEAKEKAKVVVIAGRPSHGPGEHEFNAGCKLLVKCLAESAEIDPVFVADGWPKDESVFDGARSLVFFMDGGGGHPMIQGNRLETLKKLMDKGVGLVCLHYAVEFPKGKPGDDMLEWLGGFYESGYSTNPHWTAEIKSLPKHEITRGVKPFAVRDEWYYNMRFRPDMAHVTPIIVAKPDEEARSGKTSSPNKPLAHIVAAKGRDEILAWATHRADGGRSFGFTGAHFHKNWGNDDFRTLVLNAILWTAKVEVPENGFHVTVSNEYLLENLDPKGRR